MRVSYEWLSQYVNVAMGAKELGKALTLAGIAVENVERETFGLQGVVVGKITGIQAHPDADQLSVCLVVTGEGKAPVTIVSGAPNIRRGMLVPLAMDGAVLPGNRRIQAASFRGILSQGMLCSKTELGLEREAGEADGIMELPPDTKLGADIAEVLELADEVMVMDLTPNRSDCLAMVNVAREVSAVTGAPFHLQGVSLPAEAATAAGKVSVEIEAPDLCGRYVAKIIEDVHVGPSPLWLKRRLLAAGMRPINNIVDITNYVMLEMGQPLHAFDYQTLKGPKIIVRRARPQETMTTLDGVNRGLSESMLLIADAEWPVAIAGIMGGLDTEITEHTRTVLLESAHFTGKGIRQTARQLGLSSDASSRFEKGVNIDGCALAADRAAELMTLLAGGKALEGQVDVYLRPWVAPVIKLRAKRVNEILGTSLTLEEIASILTRLHLEVRVADRNSLEVVVPSYRNDLASEIDLIEETGRLYGFHLIPTTLPKSAGAGGQRPGAGNLVEKCSSILADCGLSEVITYSFINPRTFDRMLLHPGHPLRHAIKVKNPLSEDQSVMRTTLLPGLLEVAAKNASRRIDDLAIFETGRVFLPRPGEEGELPVERLTAGGLVFGHIQRNWQRRAEELDFYYLKGVLEELFSRLNISSLEFRAYRGHPTFHPARTAEILVEQETVGLLGELHPSVQASYGLPFRTYVFQLEVDALATLRKEHVRHVPIPKFPPVTRDMAFVVDESLPAAEISRLIRQTGGTLLRQFKLFDLYQGEQVAPGKKSLAFTMVYQSPERTLTDQEVNEAHQRIREMLAQRFEAGLR